jgi:pre-rRNA-processing protein IPI1
MGKSAKARKEKKQDFQKTKLKVGKTKAKPENFTSTAFKARSM